MEFRILGPLEVVREGSLLDAGTPRLRLLVALLAVRSPGVVSAERLIDDMWESDPPETARHTLQGYVYRLRQALGPDGWRLQSRAPGYLLKTSPDELDARRFQTLAEQGREALAGGRPKEGADLLREALGLWRGSVLADVAEMVALEPERARLEAMRLGVLEDRVEADLASGWHSRVVDELNGLVSEHPFRERLWGQLMIAQYRAGRQADALHAFRRARQTLDEQLGIEPSPWLCRLEERILLHDPDLGEPRAAEAARPLHNLPSPRTSFVGRRDELADLAGLLATKRLVTVTGPPGAGKTRLALAAAEQSMPHHPHGVCLVPLAEIDEPGLITSAVAAALGVSEPERPVLDALIDHLKARRLLLVLDNLEHLLPGVAVVGRLLDAAPGLRVLATSRAPLRLSGEQEYRLAPLPVPDPEELSSAEDPDGFDALALFAERARAIDPRFTVTAGNAAPVAEIVARVDGLPLAIELAAARLRHFPLAELRRRLTDVLSLLVEGNTDQPARQQQLREAIAWSYDLLDPADQALFRRLGIVRGGFSLDAAEAVAANSPAGAVLRGISHLIEVSLLQAPLDTDPVRYSMLETIREYALDELRAHGEYEEVSRRHADLYAALVERAEPELTRAEQPRWLRRLEADHDNLRAVLRRARETGELDPGLVMAGRLWRFWHFRGRITEGRAWLDEMLALSGDAATVARAKALIGLAGLCYWERDLDGAEGHYRQAAEVARGLKHDAAEVVDEQYPIGTLLSPWWLEFESLLGLVVTIACHRGDPEAAAPLEQQVQAIVAQHAADPMAMGNGMATSALVKLFTGELDAARNYGELVVAGTRAIGERWYESQMLRTLALISLRERRYEQAEQELTACLGIASELDDLPSMAMDLDRLGQAAIGRQSPQRAVTLAGAASRVRETVGGGLAIDDFRWETVHPTDAARRVLTESEIDVAWARGRSMSPDDAVTYATDVVTTSR
ncbi:MAG: AAA family ATPase [Pseudonocardiaceae bacterium]|nr:AAA family ATPase [Pseudonocardiaceae bacterium]